MDDNSPKAAEYELVCEHIKHQDNVFFANTTIFVTIMGALFSVVFTGDHPLGAEAALYAKLSGCIASLIFGINGDIYLGRYHLLEERAIQLEHTLGYRQFVFLRRGKVGKWRGGRLAWRSMFFLSLVFWLVQVWK